MKTAGKALRALEWTLAIAAIATLLVALSGANPLEAYGVFAASLFGNLNGFCEIFVKATPLILTGLACAVAFKTGFFNIGAEGQFYIGAVAAAAVALRATALAPQARMLLAFAAGFLAGGLWALIAAWMKLRFRISEIIVTIMLNYIALNFVGVAVRTFLQDPASGMAQSEKLEAAAALPRLLRGTRLHPGIFIALALALAVWFILDRTTWGYQMRVVGLNPRAAQCAGISAPLSVTRASILSGGLAGLAGVIEFLAIQRKLLEGFSGDCGYTGVLIALLAGNRPQLVPVAAILYAAAQTGASSMQRQTGVPAAMVNILIGTVVVAILIRGWLAQRGSAKERVHRA